MEGRRGRQPQEVESARAAPMRRHAESLAGDAPHPHGLWRLLNGSRIGRGEACLGHSSSRLLQAGVPVALAAGGHHRAHDSRQPITEHQQGRGRLGVRATAHARFHLAIARVSGVGDFSHVRRAGHAHPDLSDCQGLCEHEQRAHSDRSQQHHCGNALASDVGQRPAHSGLETQAAPASTAIYCSCEMGDVPAQAASSQATRPYYPSHHPCGAEPGLLMVPVLLPALRARLHSCLSRLPSERRRSTPGQIRLLGYLGGISSDDAGDGLRRLEL
mmetsp:Transcript_28226/g.61639  ORF Transcript_28226/g.61639 Transcript_28226/m.61639 type:complete len:273 (+) Transcript_28226:682-1500(+)